MKTFMSVVLLATVALAACSGDNAEKAAAGTVSKPPAAAQLVGDALEGVRAEWDPGFDAVAQGYAKGSVEAGVAGLRGGIEH